jgi:iron-sulfur cluster assembly accessory protein
MTNTIESDCGNTITLADQSVRPDVTLTEPASQRIATLLETDPTVRALRLAVSGGGCAGFQYVFGLESDVQPDDFVFVDHNATVVIDETSMDFLKGSTIDFVSDFGGEYFRVTNPHAKSECGCGSSFAPEM